MLYKRAERVGDLLREIISEIILRDLNDPRLDLITITEVEITDDLKIATVFFSAMGNKAKEEESLCGLQRAAGYIKKRLGKELRLRYIPQLVFKIDRSFDYGSKIDRLLKDLREEKDRDHQEDS
ncbi:MAG: 30S ribosome-binding factor RbfA [Thermodesulfobacteriota bacterium]